MELLVFVSVLLFGLLQLALKHHFRVMPKTHREYWWFVRHGKICVNITWLIQHSAYFSRHGDWFPPSTAFQALRQRTNRNAVRHWRCQHIVGVEQSVCSDLHVITFFYLFVLPHGFSVFSFHMKVSQNQNRKTKIWPDATRSILSPTPVRMRLMGQTDRQSL